MEPDSDLDYFYSDPQQNLLDMAGSELIFGPQNCMSFNPVFILGMFDKNQTGQIDVTELGALFDYLNRWKVGWDLIDYLNFHILLKKCLKYLKPFVIVLVNVACILPVFRFKKIIAFQLNFLIFNDSYEINLSVVLKKMF